MDRNSDSYAGSAEFDRRCNTDLFPTMGLFGFIMSVCFVVCLLVCLYISLICLNISYMYILRFPFVYLISLLYAGTEFVFYLFIGTTVFNFVHH